MKTRYPPRLSHHGAGTRLSSELDQPRQVHGGKQQGRSPPDATPCAWRRDAPRAGRLL